MKEDGTSLPLRRSAQQPAFVKYQLEPALSREEYADVLRRSTLAERRPVDDPDRLDAMLRNASLIVTARQETRLVGISRAVTDYAFCTYLSDLAVDQEFQGQGIGSELIRRTHAAAGLCTRLILLAAPRAETFYPHIGMQPHHSCWQLPPVAEFRSS